MPSRNRWPSDALVGDDRREAPDRVQVVDGRVEPRQQLVRERAGLEPPAQRAGGRGAGLVGPPALDHLGPPVGDAEMRAAELVRRADQHVGADLPDVDRLVRRVVDGVDPGQRAGVVRELAHPPGVHDRADRVGRPRERDHPGARPELALQVLEVERRVVVQLDVPDDQAGVVRELQPRARRRRRGPARRPGSHRPGWKPRAAVRDSMKFSEVMFGPKITSWGSQPRNRAALRSASARISPDAQARGVARAQVGAGLAQRPRDRLADLVGHLRAARGVEEREVLCRDEKRSRTAVTSSPGGVFRSSAAPLYAGTGEPQIAIESQLPAKPQKCFPCPGVQRMV